MNNRQIMLQVQHKTESTQLNRFGLTLIMQVSDSELFSKTPSLICIKPAFNKTKLQLQCLIITLSVQIGPNRKIWVHWSHLIQSELVRFVKLQTCAHGSVCSLSIVPGIWDPRGSQVPTGGCQEPMLRLRTTDILGSSLWVLIGYVSKSAPVYNNL